MLQPGRPWDRQRTRPRLVAQVRPELAVGTVRLGREGRVDRRQRGHVGHQPGLRAVAVVAVAEQHHGRPVGDRDAAGLVRRVEAVRGRLGGDDRQRGLAVTSEQRQQQVGLFGLRRQAGRRTRPLHVDHDERQFEHHRETEHLGLQRHARTGRRRRAQVSGIGRPECGPDRGDLVLGLEGHDALVLRRSELGEDVGRRSDRVGAEEQRQPGPRRTGHEAERDRLVAGDLPVGAAADLGGCHLVAHRERLGRVAQVVTGLESRAIGVPQRRPGREPALQERQRRLGGAGEQPGDEAEGVHVAGAGGVGAGQAQVRDGRRGEPGQVEGVDVVVVEAAVGQRVRGVVDLGEVPRAELGGVGDDRAAALEVDQVGAQGRGVHGDEDVHLVAGGLDVDAGEVHLEAGDAADRALRRADLGGVQGQGREVVADEHAVGGEAVAGELHAVAGIAREADHHTVAHADVSHEAPLSNESVPTVTAG